MDLLLRHVATVPDELWHKPILGFGHPSVWTQLVHILTSEEGWVHDLQNRSFVGWYAEDCPTMAELRASKDRTREATRTYLESVSSQRAWSVKHKRTGTGGSFAPLGAVSEDLNDAERLAADPTFRLISSQRIWDRGAALGPDENCFTVLRTGEMDIHWVSFLRSKRRFALLVSFRKFCLSIHIARSR